MGKRVRVDRQAVRKLQMKALRAMRDDGVPARLAAAVLGLGIATVRRWLGRERRRQDLADQVRGE